jgi:hypothetical protein
LPDQDTLIWAGAESPKIGKSGAHKICLLLKLGMVKIKVYSNSPCLIGNEIAPETGIFVI